jgi:hypothetical protein
VRLAVEFFGAEPVCDVLPGRREEAYAEFVWVNEHTRAGPPESAGGRNPVAEVEAAGTTTLGA